MKKPRFLEYSEATITFGGTTGPDMGIKMDTGKPRMSLLFMEKLRPAVVSLVRILEYGAKKYPAADNWVKVENGTERYRDAAFRHLAAHAAGQTLDEESGLPHLAHAACSALFALALEVK